MPGTLKEKIVIHVGYREIFKAPIVKGDLAQYLGVNHDNGHHFEQSVSELIAEGVLEEKDGYLVSNGNTTWIDQQRTKDDLTEELIRKGGKVLALVSKLPFIKFIGISGSLAAKNPDLSASSEKIDIDLFVITSENTLWLFSLAERIIRNVYKLIFGQHFYCFNYVTDQRFLEIYSKNFYTATELVNLVKVYDAGFYTRLVEANLWYKKYYCLEMSNEPPETPLTYRWLSKALFPLNFLCFMTFCILRSVKRMQLEPIQEIGVIFNPKHKANLNRISNGNGGYQEAVKKRFSSVLRDKFPGYYSEKTMEDLFPSSESFEFDEQSIYGKEFVELFGKYA